MKIPERLEREGKGKRENIKRARRGRKGHSVSKDPELGILRAILEDFRWLVYFKWGFLWETG